MSDSEITRLRRKIEEVTRAKEAAEAREEQERREKEQLRHENQPTTLDEYLRNCHIYLYKSLKLADKSVSSTGFTKVDGKFYPKWLRPWTQFADSLRQQQFDVILDACGDERLFYQESTARDNGKSISHRLAGNEDAITHFERVAVEDPVFAILLQLGGQEAIRAKYGFSRLRFSGRNTDVIVQPVRTLSTESQTNESSTGRRGLGLGKFDASRKGAFPTSRQHPQLERYSLFKGNECNTLYTEAETLIKANCIVFEDSIRHELQA